jgi:hypothetical protein
LRNNQNLSSKNELPLAYQTELVDECDFDGLKNYVKQIKKERKTFQKLIKKFEELSAKEFFGYYKNFYYWDNDELMEKLIKNHLNDFEEIIIHTDDIFEKYTKLGYGTDCIWDKDYYYADYVVYAEKGILDKDKIYTKQEVSNLIKAKKLIVKEIECSKDIINKTDSQIELDLISLKNINIDSKVDFLSYGFYESQNKIDDKVISDMYSANPTAFKLIKQEFSKERLENAFDSYEKQFEIAKNKCFKKAYNLIKNKKKHIDGQEEKVSKIKNFICNL